jgi:fumarate hydratase subunit alpha
MSNKHRYSLTEITHQVRDGLLHAVTHLEEPLVQRLQSALETERRALKGMHDIRIETSIQVLEMIMENLKIADESQLPLCQDTGMVVGIIEIGDDCPFSMQEIEQALNAGIYEAVVRGYFRNSIVTDPLFERINTNSNLPAVLYWMPKRLGLAGLTISLMLKGFGSENCGGVAMLSPTAGEDGVVEAIAAIVRKAGGKPCPPIIVGVGLGGTMDKAALLSKKALFRTVGDPHHDVRYAALEGRIMDRLQQEHIGSGGFGGTVTALAVAVEHYPTHIAGLPVAVSISCWADRKTICEFGGSHEA